MKIKKILSILIIVVIALLAFAIFKKFNPSDKLPEGQLSEKQISSLTKKVSKLINIPAETPVIATIIKADQLIAEQSFYIGSKDGDYLMIFSTAKKAIIYREKENRIINVGPIIIDEPKATSTQEVVDTTEKTETASSSKIDTKTKN